LEENFTMLGVQFLQ